MANVNVFLGADLSGSNPFSGITDPLVKGAKNAITPPSVPPGAPTNASGLPSVVPQRSSPTDQPVRTPEQARQELQTIMGQNHRDELNSLMDQNAPPQPGQADPSLPNGPSPLDIPGQIGELGKGVNRWIADTIGLPADLIDNVVRTAGGNMFDHPGDGAKAVRDAFNKVGVNTDETKNIFNQAGGALPQAMIEAAAWLYAAPYLATIKGTNAASFIVKDLADYASNNQTRELVAWLAGGLGAKIGEIKGGPLGAIAGGAGGAFGAQKIGDILGDPVKFFARLLSSPEATPIRPTGGEIGVSQSYAADQIKGDVQKTQDAIEAAIKAVPRTGSPEETSSALFSKVLAARDYSNSVEDALWSRVPKNTPVSQVDVTGLEADMLNIQKEAAKVSPKTIPDQTVAEIRQVIASTRPVVDPDTGRIIRNGKPVQVERLLGLHSDIRAQIRADRISAANGSKVIPQGYVANLEALDEAVLTTVEKTIPSNVALQQARDYTRAQAQMFKQGPVGRIMNWKQTGEGAVLPEQAAPALMQAPNGLEQARSADQFATTGAPSVTPQQASAAFLPNHPGQVAPAAPGPNGFGVEQGVEDYIRSQFRAAGDESGQAALSFINKNAQRVKYFSGVANDFNKTQQEIIFQQQKADLIGQSSLAKFAQAPNGKAAVSTIFSAQSPAKAAAELVGRLNGNSDAMAGLKAGVIDKLMADAGENPARFKELVVGKQVGDKVVPSPARSILNEVFTPEEVTRLTRIATLAAEAEKGAGFKLRNVVAGGSMTILRIAFAKAGRVVSGLAGAGGTLQAPAIFSQYGRELGEKIFRMATPSELLTWAVKDPRWEKVLYTKVPADITEIKALDTQMRRLIYVTQAGKTIVQDEASQAMNNRRKR